MTTAFLKQRQGKLEIGLNEYQEAQWLAAIKRYGTSIMDKSLLGAEQKKVLAEIAKQS